MINTTQCARSAARILVCVLFLSTDLLSEEVSVRPMNRTDPAQVHPGIVVWWGGGDPPGTLFEQLEKESSGRSIAVVTVQSELNSSLRDWCRSKNREIVTFSVTEPRLERQLRSYDAVWIEANDLSAQANVLDRIVVSTEFLKPEPAEPVISLLKSNPGRIGIGIPPNTAVVTRGRRLDIVGASDAVVCVPASVSRPADRPLALWKYKPGTEADLIALSRAAMARLGEPFPPEASGLSEVPTGSLLACGGGDLPDSIWQRFIDLAGGVESPLVVIPIATPRPDDPAPKGLDRLKRLGCLRVTVLNQHTKDDVQTEEFTEALKEAKGVWFVGGRQWKYIDAYEDFAEPLFHDVLKRGGVIGGSSAGAAVQSEYMVRGSPLGNREIIAEGYERGLNFLPGCAIDIHVTERRRLNDLIGLIRTYPRLLGIGIDEDTAIEVRGRTFTVLGERNVNIVEHENPNALTLKAGDRFDLVQRRPIQ